MKHTIYWNKEEGSATAVIYRKNKVFVGKAKCHPNDNDMCSEKVGYELAYTRAQIKMYKEVKREKYNKFNILNTAYNTLAATKRFNPDSFEAKSLKKQVDKAWRECQEIENMIKDFEMYLTGYITMKDNFYKKIRAMRQDKID